MKFDPDKHHRRSIRLRGYDYTRAGAYFITIVTQNRECLFGEIADGTMRLNEAGHMVERWWKELSNKYQVIQTDEYVVMPNHFHGIVTIIQPDVQGGHAGPPLQQPGYAIGVGADLRVRPGRSAHTKASLSAIVQWFKTMTTNEYIRGVNERGWTPFHGRLWQRDYYEHVVRNEEDLNDIRQYILCNPAKWAEDDENPEA